MPAASLKRSRLSKDPPHGSIRDALASRVAFVDGPGFWTTSSSGTDASLCQLGQSVAEALRAVPTSAETARAQLREVRAALHASVDARCDELERSIAAAQSAKVSVLEHELVSIDSALDSLRSASIAVRKAVASFSDHDLLAQNATLNSQLESSVAQLQALPKVVVEPPHVGFSHNLPALLTDLASFGRVLAPLSVSAADLTLREVPWAAIPGATLRLRLSLGARHADQSTEELEVSQAPVATTISTVASFEVPGAEPQALVPTISTDPARRCLYVSLVIPDSSPAESFIRLSRASVADRSVLGLPDVIIIPVCRGIRAPRQLNIGRTLYAMTPCITQNGLVFSPIPLGPDVVMFDGNGARLPGIPIAMLGLSHSTNWSAYAHCSGSVSSSVLVAGSDRLDRSRVVCVDVDTLSVRWSAAPDALLEYHGVAALPTQGIAVIRGQEPHPSRRSALVYHRLSDGVRVGSVSSAGGSSLAADPATGFVFASCTTPDYKEAVHAWSWAADASGLRAEPPVAAAGAEYGFRHLAVMPPAPGKRIAFLVVGFQGKSELRVVSLPALALVHTHTLEGMQVSGLAADPWGGALVVCDMASTSLHILAWPLPGMPPLE